MANLIYFVQPFGY